MWWVVLAVAAGAGLFAGGAWKRLRPVVETPAPPEISLRAGQEFPDVAVVAPDGAAHRSRDLARTSGGLVLLLDPECPPCERMAEEWERRRRSGAPATAGLVAIAEGTPETARAFAEEFSLGFPVYADTGRQLHSREGVDDFPLAVWVDTAGVVTGATFDPRVESVPVPK